MEETLVLTYTGPPALVGALADELSSQGVTCDYTPPIEYKDMALALAAVSVALAATGPLPQIVAGVRAFTRQFGNTSVSGLPALTTVQDRLADVERLFADGDISRAERDEQRRRILDEL